MFADRPKAHSENELLSFNAVKMILFESQAMFVDHPKAHSENELLSCNAVKMIMF